MSGESLWDLNARDLLARTASAAPTPGGGSVAGVTAALGLGLVVMALEVSANHKNAAPGVPDLLGRARDLLPQLAQGADEDARAFEGYMAALGLPKVTEQEKAARKEALQAAALEASRVPLTAGLHTLSALELASEAAELSAGNVVSDVGAGAALLGGALQASLLGVDINLAHVPPERRPELEAERRRLQARGEDVERAVLERVAARLSQ